MRGMGKRRFDGSFAAKTLTRAKTIPPVKQARNRALDSRSTTSMSTSTRFNLKFLGVLSKIIHPGKLHFTFFHQKG